MMNLLSGEHEFREGHREPRLTDHHQKKGRLVDAISNEDTPDYGAPDKDGNTRKLQEGQDNFYNSDKK